MSPVEYLDSAGFDTEAGISYSAGSEEFYIEMLQTFAEEEEYAVETRDLDGVSCEVEVFPVYKLRPETAFYFNEDGDLIRIDEGDSTVYTVEAVDDAIDAGLFDLSAYRLS